MPPRNNLPTDVSTIAPSGTNEIDGGMMGPALVAPAITALEKAGLKPGFLISGNSAVRVAAQSAKADPEAPHRGGSGYGMALITAGELLKYRKGFRLTGAYVTSLSPGRS